MASHSRGKGSRVARTNENTTLKTCTTRSVKGEVEIFGRGPLLRSNMYTSQKELLEVPRLASPRYEKHLPVHHCSLSTLAI